MEIEPAEINTAGSISTAGSINIAKLNSHSSDIKKAHFPQQAKFPHPGSISTSLTLKSVILFLTDFKKSSCLGKKDFFLIYLGVN